MEIRRNSYLMVCSFEAVWPSHAFFADIHILQQLQLWWGLDLCIHYFLCIRNSSFVEIWHSIRCTELEHPSAEPQEVGGFDSDFLILDPFWSRGINLRQRTGSGIGLRSKWDAYKSLNRSLSPIVDDGLKPEITMFLCLCFLLRRSPCTAFITELLIACICLSLLLSEAGSSWRTFGGNDLQIPVRSVPDDWLICIDDDDAVGGTFDKRLSRATILVRSSSTSFSKEVILAWVSCAWIFVLRGFFSMKDFARVWHWLHVHVIESNTADIRSSVDSSKSRHFPWYRFLHILHENV